ncbi:hypothetical protein ABGV49_20415 [Chromobacterium vaccinii]|uniref:Secreted protein n=1 Tax=Chromobacterium vaccinii TaxID=1108595 RepID=A0ABV0FK67_9NEIS
MILAILALLLIGMRWGGGSAWRFLFGATGFFIQGGRRPCGWRLLSPRHHSDKAEFSLSYCVQIVRVEFAKNENDGDSKGISGHVRAHISIQYKSVHLHGWFFYLFFANDHAIIFQSDN